MMKNRIRLKQKYHSGQSLVSLMLSISLSSFLLLVILQFYSQHQQQNREMLLRLQLQTELQRVVQLMGKDLARTGFRAVSEKLTKDNLSLFEQPNQPSAITIAQMNAEKNNSVLYFFMILMLTVVWEGNIKAILVWRMGEMQPKKLNANYSVIGSIKKCWKPV